jgi:hypothetical protein
MPFRLTRERWIEVALLLPTTVMLGSALPFGIFFTLLALFAGLLTGVLGGATALHRELRSSSELAGLLLMMLGATAGLMSLWLNLLFGRDWALQEPRRRYGLLLALMLGLAATAYWFSHFDIPPQSAREWKALWEWIGLLLPPSALAIRHLWILIASPSKASGFRY